MLSKLIEFSLKQRILVLLLVAMIIGGGSVAFKNIPIDAFPDISSPQVKIILKAPGMTPEEVESRIIFPIEVELLGIQNQRLLRSTSKYAIADITLDFKEGTDIYWARAQVAEKLNAVLPNLPEGVSGGLAPITTPLGEVLMFTVEGNLSLQQKRTLLDWTIRPALRTVPGVADINSLGGKVKSFVVTPNVALMSSLGLDMASLESAIRSNNKNDGAGRISEHEESLLVRSEGSIKTLDDVRAIVVKSTKDHIVKVGDIAQVGIGELTRYGFVTQSGRDEAVEGLVLSLKGANAKQVVSDIKQKLTSVQATLPKGVTLNVFYDRSMLVDKAVSTVSRALIEATVLVLVLLALFLGDARAATTVALILPLSALCTFMMMQLFGMSANLMSLGGLAIAIGMLVDSAVVVVENVVTQLGSAKSGALPKLHIIYRASKEVASPVVSGILIIAIVFLPLLSLEGLEGKLFIPVALTIIFALISSLFLALTVIPVLSAMLIRSGHEKESWLVHKMMAMYEPTLSWALANSKKVFIGVGVALVATVWLYIGLGKSFMPTMDEGDIIIGIESVPSSSLDGSKELNLRLQRALMQQVPEIKGIVARSGSDELGLDPMGLNQTDTFLVLKPKEQWRKPDKEWLTGELQKVLEQFPGIAFSFTQPIEMRVSEMLTGVRGDVAVKIFGSSIAQLNELSAKTVEVLKKTQGSSEVYTTLNEGADYLKIEIDRLALGHYGLNAEEVEGFLRTLLEGMQVGSVMEEGSKLPLLIRGDDAYSRSSALLSSATLATPGGSAIPLSSVTKISRIDGPVKIDRENGMRMSVVRCNVEGRDLVGFVEDAKARFEKELKLPSGYMATWGGQFENQQRAAKRLAIVVPVAIGLIFLILFMTFGSSAQALLVLANVPLAMIGGIVGLFISGEYLSVPASVGFIALLGIAVLNGVVLVSYFNQLKALGMPIAQVVFEGSKRRLRPVLLTASIAAFGLVPLLFASGPGSELQRPLAIVVVGGLVSSTLLTLVVLPIAYRMLEGRRKNEES